ncbi:MAG TPA: hypothetical protein VHH35_12245, partial [Pyrinomonadaceae bacterium]|nr:hypothetical protein [Pyrinomonadaceae bacterium]
MNNRFSSFALLIVAIFATFTIESQAQPRNRNTRATAVPNGLMASLPQSDAVAQIKMKQLFNEAMPRILANNPARLAQVNAAVEDFKTRTGLDPRMFDELALGARFSFPGAGVTRVQTVALAKGAFSSAAMIAAGRVASNGKYREEKYQGKTIHVFTLDQDIRVLGVLNFKIAELAAVALDT